MWGWIACLAGIHHWSEWKVADLEQPWKQVRTCTRCRHKSNNFDSVPIRASNHWLN
jgi:hypothetical protein